MSPLARLINALADRLRQGDDALNAARGLVAVTLPDGRRVVRHPGMPAIAAAHRARVLARPDAIDRMLATSAVQAFAAREARAGRAASAVIR